MSRFSPTVNFSGVSPLGQGLASLSDAFLRAYTLRHNMKREDAQDADTHAAREAGLYQQGVRHGTAPTEAPVDVPISGIGVPGLVPDSAPAAGPPQYDQISRDLYVDRTATPYAQALERSRLTGEMSLNRALTEQYLRNAGALDRVAAQGAQYGTTDPSGAFTPGVRTLSTLTTQAPGVALGRDRLTETGRHNRVTEGLGRDRNAISRNTAIFRQSTAGQITPKDIYRRGTALMAPQTTVNPDAPYRAAALMTPGLSADSAMARAAREAQTANRVYGGQPTGSSAAPGAAPAQTGGTAAPGALREFQALNDKVAELRRRKVPEDKIRAAVQQDIAAISAKYRLTPNR